MKKFIYRLFRGKLAFIIDRSFYSSRLYLISAAWFISFSKKIVGLGNFVSLVAEAYWYPYVIELFSLLLIAVVINIILLRYPYPSVMMQLEIKSDY